MSFYCNTFLTEGFCSVLKVFPNSETFHLYFFHFFCLCETIFQLCFETEPIKKSIHFKILFRVFLTRLEVFEFHLHVH